MNPFSWLSQQVFSYYNYLFKCMLTNWYLHNPINKLSKKYMRQYRICHLRTFSKLREMPKCRYVSNVQICERLHKGKVFLKTWYRVKKPFRPWHFINKKLFPALNGNSAFLQEIIYILDNSKQNIRSAFFSLGLILVQTKRYFWKQSFRNRFN